MVFLLPIPIALVLALCWASWVSRPRRPVEPTQSVEQWGRAVAALAPEPRQPKRLARSR